VHFGSPQVQDGYPTYYVASSSYQPLCVPYDPVTRLPRTNATDIYPSFGQTLPLGGSSFQFLFNYYIDGVYQGDYITVSPCHMLSPRCSAGQRRCARHANVLIGAHAQSQSAS
jgi:hypothetical protein